MTSNSLGRPTHFVTLPVQETIVIQIGHETDHPFCCLQAMFAPITTLKEATSILILSNPFILFKYIKLAFYLHLITQ